MRSAQQRLRGTSLRRLYSLGASGTAHGRAPGADDFNLGCEQLWRELHAKGIAVISSTENEQTDDAQTVLKKPAPNILRKIIKSSVTGPERSAGTRHSKTGLNTMNRSS